MEEFGDFARQGGCAGNDSSQPPARAGPDLPEDQGIRQGALIPTAYYTGDTFRPAARRPLSDVLHVDRW